MGQKWCFMLIPENVLSFFFPESVVSGPPFPLWVSNPQILFFSHCSLSSECQLLSLEAFLLCPFAFEEFTHSSIYQKVQGGKRSPAACRLRDYKTVNEKYNGEMPLGFLDLFLQNSVVFLFQNLCPENFTHLKNKIVIKKLDARKYEESLKEEFTNWIKNGNEEQVISWILGKALCFIVLSCVIQPTIPYLSLVVFNVFQTYFFFSFLQSTLKLGKSPWVLQELDGR